MHKLGLWMQLVEKIPSLEANRRFKHLASKIRILNLMHELRNRKLQKSKIIFYSFFFQTIFFCILSILGSGQLMTVVLGFLSNFKNTSRNMIVFLISTMKTNWLCEVSSSSTDLWLTTITQTLIVDSFFCHTPRFKFFFFKVFFSYFTFLHFLTLLKPFG